MPAGAKQLELLSVPRGPSRYSRQAEFRLTVAVADTLRRFARPDWQWTHFPSGELRDVEIKVINVGGKVQVKRRSPSGERLKRMGLQPGWPDFILISPLRVVHFLELKAGRSPRLSDPQDNFAGWCEAHDVSWAVALGYRAAIDFLNSIGVFRMHVEVQ